MSRGPKWTEEEDQRLSFDWGVFQLKTVSRRLGRTQQACLARARKLDLGLPGRGTQTVGGISTATGYHRVAIRSAARALGIAIGRRISTNTTWKDPTRRHTAIDEEDVERIIDFLAAKPDAKRIRFEHKGAWGEPGRGGVMKPDRCVECGTNERPHYAKGRCERCYDRLRKTNRPGSRPRLLTEGRS